MFMDSDLADKISLHAIVQEASKNKLVIHIIESFFNKNKLSINTLINNIVQKILLNFKKDNEGLTNQNYIKKIDFELKKYNLKPELHNQIMSKIINKIIK